MHPTIQVIDNNQVLTISMEDILKYHGGLLPGGCAQAFQAMRAGFAKLSNRCSAAKYLYKPHSQAPEDVTPSNTSPVPIPTSEPPTTEH